MAGNIIKDLGVVTAYAYAVLHGYTGTEEEFTQEIGNASMNAQAAAISSREAESWAKGTKNGTPVESSDPAYHNSAKYYSEQAADNASGALSAKDAAVAAAATASSAYDVNLLAPNYTDLTFPVKAGQHCIYSGGLYKAKQGIETSESWTAAHWENAIIGAELLGIYNSTQAILNAIGTKATPVSLTAESGYYWNAQTSTAVKTEGSDSYKAYNAVPVQPGEKYTVTGYYAYNAYQYLTLIVDADYQILARYGTQHDHTETYEFVIPDNGAYILMTTLTSKTVTCSKITLSNLINTIDDYPSASSSNPVKSSGIYAEQQFILTGQQKIIDALGTNENAIDMTRTTGHYWDSQNTTATDGTTPHYSQYTPISVSPQEKYKVYGFDANGTKQHLVLVVDEDYTILARYGEHSHSYKTYEFTIPAGGAYILITTLTSRYAYCYKIDLNEIPTDVYAGRYNFAGKNIAIIGDSISTNGDYSASNNLGNVPEIVIEEEDVGVELSAYVTYYDIGTTVGGHEIVEADVGTELTFTPVEGDIGKIVGKPKNNNAASIKTWWEVAQDVLGFNVIPVCWSGSSITDHDENVQDNGHYIYKCAHSFHPSQIRKCGIRTPGTMTRTAPDTIIIYRGTNDLSHSPYAHITDYMDSFPTTYPTADTYDDGGTTKYDYAKGMRMLIKALRDAYPAARIALCTLNYFRRLSTTAKWTSNGTDTWQMYNDTIRKIAECEGCDLIDFAKDGLNWANAYDGYYNEGSSSTAHWTHPTTKGHKVLGNRALRDMQTFNSMT